MSTGCHDHEHVFPVEMKWEGVMGSNYISLKEKLFFTLFFLDDSGGGEGRTCVRLSTIKIYKLK